MMDVQEELGRGAVGDALTRAEPDTRGPTSDPGTWESVRRTVVRQALAGPAAVLAFLLWAIHGIWRGVTTGQGFFTQHDHLALRDAAGNTLGLDHLLTLHAGEFSPVGRLLVHATVSAGGPEWAPVAAVVLVGQAATGVLLWVVLSLLLPGRWVRLPLFALALFSPLTLGDTMTWSSAVSYLPGTLLLLLAAAGILLFVSHGWAPGQFVAAVALVGTVVVSDRVFVLALMVFFLVAAVREPTAPGASSSAAARLRSTVVGHLWLWALLVAALVARVVLGVSSGWDLYRVPTAPGAVIDTVLLFVRQFAVGVVGGPWEGVVIDGSLRPELQWTVALGVLACLALAVPVLRAVRAAQVRVALSGMMVLLVSTIALVVFTRGEAGAPATVPRAASALLVPLLVLVAAALRQVRLSSRAGVLVARSPGGAALVVTLALVVSASASGRLLTPSLKNSDDRAYVGALRSGLATDPTIVLLDGPTPDGVIHPWFGADAQVSTITDAFGETPPFGIPSDRLRIVDERGGLHPVELDDPVPALTTGDDACRTSVSSAPTALAFAETVPGGDVVLAFDYLASERSSMIVSDRSDSVRVVLPPGLASIQVPMQGGFGELGFAIDGPGQVCLAKIFAGTPASPEPTG